MNSSCVGRCPKRGIPTGTSWLLYMVPRGQSVYRDNDTAQLSRRPSAPVAIVYAITVTHPVGVDASPAPAELSNGTALAAQDSSYVKKFVESIDKMHA